MGHKLWPCPSRSSFKVIVHTYTISQFKQNVTMTLKLLMTNTPHRDNLNRRIDFDMYTHTTSFREQKCDHEI